LKEIPLFKRGQILKAEDLNILVQEIRRLQNIQADRNSELEVLQTQNGILIRNRKKYILIDDLYKIDEAFNDSTKVQRRCDEKLADIADFFRVRAYPSRKERDNGIYKTIPAYGLMQYIQNELGVDGGWVTDGGFGHEEEGISKKKSSAPPAKHVAQWQSMIILTDDDIEGFNEDGDGHTYINIRDDAHFHRSPSKDGRIFFTDTPAGNEPSGFEIKGEMIGDPALANADTELLRESVEWRPQLKIPNLDIEGEVYTPVNSAGYSFPPAIRIPGSSIIAYEFGSAGKDEGWSAHYQPHHKLEQYGLGFMIKYTAENETGSPLNAYMELDWKIADNGDDISTAGLTSSDFLLPVPAGNSETDLIHAFVGFVAPTQYIDKSLVVVPLFARDAGNGQDTLADRLFIIEVKMIYMTVIVPPGA